MPVDFCLEMVRVGNLTQSKILRGLYHLGKISIEVIINQGNLNVLSLRIGE